MNHNLIKTGNFVLKSKHNDREFIADARYLSDGNKKPIILFVHGFKGFKDWGCFNLIADSFAKAGFVYVKLNLSHNGTTPENPTDFVDLDAFSENNFSIELDDIEVVIDHLCSSQSNIPSEEVEIKNFHLIGHSRGGALVLLKAYEDSRVKSVTAWAPIDDIQERWAAEGLREQWAKDGVHYVYNGRTEQNMPMKYQLLEDVLDNSSRLDIPKVVSSMTIPMLLIHGTDDSTLPYENTVELAETNSLAQLKIIENASHVFGGSHPYPEDTDELPADTQLLMEYTLGFLSKI